MGGRVQREGTVDGTCVTLAQLGCVRRCEENEALRGGQRQEDVRNTRVTRGPVGQRR